MKLKLAILDGYLTTSHQLWAESLRKMEDFEVKVFSLPARHWKVHSRVGALVWSEELNQFEPDLVIITDMVDGPLVKSLLKSPVPIVTYFHENQLSYFWSPFDKDKETGRDHHFSFQHFTSCLISDAILFNSSFHMNDFYLHLEKFLSALPGPSLKNRISEIKSKSEILPIPIRETFFQKKTIAESDRPLITWNHRWEYDKNPEEFLQLLIALDEESIEFDLALLGEVKGENEVQKRIQEKFKNNIIYQGHLPFGEYVETLIKTTLFPVTSFHDFFGISVIEAMLSGVRVLLPNRQVYPDLVAPELRAEVLYENFEELLNKSKQALEFNDDQHVQVYRKRFVSFKEETVVEKYNQFFKNILS